MVTRDLLCAIPQPFTLDDSVCVTILRHLSIFFFVVSDETLV